MNFQLTDEQRRCAGVGTSLESRSGFFLGAADD